MRKCTLFLFLIFLFPLISFTQSFNSDYQDGKIWFKLSNETRFELELNQNPEKLPLTTIPGFQLIASKYGATNLAKPFHIAKQSKELQLTFEVTFTDFSKVEQFIKIRKFCLYN